MKNRKYLFVVCLLFIFLTGCWDVVNIEDRGFVIGNSIDLIDGEDAKSLDLLVTNQMVVGAGMPTITQGGGEEKAFINFKTTGRSIFKMEEEVATISNKVPYYEHLTTLVVSEDIAKKEHLFSNLLDTYIRNVNLRRGIKVVITKDEANKVLEYTTPGVKLPSMHIEELLERSSRETGLFTPTTLGDIEEYHLRKNSYVLPYLEMEEILSYKAGAVFHGPQDKMVGLFNMDDMLALSFFQGENTTKIIEFPYQEHPFALQVIRLYNSLTVDPSNINEITVNLELEIEGIIKEIFIQRDLTQEDVIQSVQEDVSKEVENRIAQTFAKAQEEFGTDVFRIWQALETKHYDTWQQVKDDWEEGEYHFKKVNFNVDVITEIYSIGATNRTK